MTLHYPHRSRERILTFGAEGAGKTQIACQLARAVVSPDCRVHVIETDPAWDRMLEDPEFAVLLEMLDDGQLVLHQVHDWPGFRDAMTDIWADVSRDDWVIIDNLANPWTWVRDWYWREILGEERDEFLLRIRKAEIQGLKAKRGEDASSRGQLWDGGVHKATEEDFSEWDFINPHWSKHVIQPLLNPPCHTYLTTWAKEWVARFDDNNKDLASIYKAYGCKPEGQKMTGRLTHTVLLLTKTAVGKYLMTTVKDRGGRAELDRYEWTDVAEYLTDVGWVEVDDGGAVSKSKPKSKPKVKP